MMSSHETAKLPPGYYPCPKCGFISIRDEMRCPRCQSVAEQPKPQQLRGESSMVNKLLKAVDNELFKFCAIGAAVVAGGALAIAGVLFLGALTFDIDDYWSAGAYIAIPAVSVLLLVGLCAWLVSNRTPTAEEMAELDRRRSEDRATWAKEGRCLRCGGKRESLETESYGATVCTRCGDRTDVTKY